jgi:pyrroline-5-carboxylate reductase
MGLGIIGGGVMGEAILARLISGNIFPPHEIWVSDPQTERRQFLCRTYGVEAVADNGIPARQDILLLAVKPQHFLDLVQHLPPLAPEQVVISIMAGVTIAQLETYFVGQPVARVMPNTPARVGASASAVAFNQRITEQHKTQVCTILRGIGTVVEVPETLMDAVTGLAGSGPAYVAIVIEALADGGVRMGLPRSIAHHLAVQTVLGTAQLLQETGLHPAQLKDQVASAGGTTIAGIEALEHHGLRSALISAVSSATKRSIELKECVS